MSVYVDNMRASLGRMVMCHMIADSTDELLAMADKIGVQRKWIQKAGTNREHFDICGSKRKLAVQFGAKEVTTRELVRMNLRRPLAAAPETEGDAITRGDCESQRNKFTHTVKQTGGHMTITDCD